MEPTGFKFPPIILEEHSRSSWAKESPTSFHHPCFLGDFLFAEDKIGPNNKNKRTERLVFISKARPLDSGMFLCHFQILYRVPAETRGHSRDRPGQGSNRNTAFKSLYATDNLRSSRLFLPVKICLWNLPRGFSYAPDLEEFKPPRTPRPDPQVPLQGGRRDHRDLDPRQGRKSPLVPQHCL